MSWGRKKNKNLQGQYSLFFSVKLDVDVSLRNMFNGNSVNSLNDSMICVSQNF